MTNKAEIGEALKEARTKNSRMHAVIQARNSKIGALEDDISRLRREVAARDELLARGGHTETCVEALKFRSEMLDYLYEDNVLGAQGAVNDMAQLIIKCLPFVICEDAPCHCGRADLAKNIAEFLTGKGWEIQPNVMRMMGDE